MPSSFWLVVLVSLRRDRPWIHIDKPHDEPHGRGDSGSRSRPNPATRSRRRESTSKVWLDFEEVTAMEEGKEIRIAAVCHYCL